MTRSNPLLVALLLAALPALVARASEPAARRIVVLEDAGPTAPSFQETLRELLGRLSIELVSGSSASPERVLARVRISSLAGGLRVAVSRGMSGPLFVQREVVSGEPPAVLAETAAHIVLGAVEPLAQAEPAANPPSLASSSSSASASVSVAQPPGSAPAAASSTPPLSAVSERAAVEDRREKKNTPLVVFGARATGRWLGSERAGLGGGGRLALRWQDISVGFEADWLKAPGVELRQGRVELGALSLRGVAQMRVASWGRWSLEPGVALGVDRFVLAPRGLPPVARVSDGERWAPVVGVLLGNRVRLGASVDLVVGAGVDLDLAPGRWVLRRGADEHTLFATARFRPFLSLGLELAPLRIEGAP